MPREERGYQAFIERLKAEWEQAAPETGLAELIDQTQAYLAAAEELTRDELSLIAEYVRHDLREFDDAPGGYQDSAFYHALQESIWGSLLELTDRTQVEWQSLLDEVQHKGLYHAGELMGLGVLVCDGCGYRRLVLHPERLRSCIQCGGEHYHREPLEP